MVLLLLEANRALVRKTCPVAAWWRAQICYYVSEVIQRCSKMRVDGVLAAAVRASACNNTYRTGRLCMHAVV